LWWSDNNLSEKIPVCLQCNKIQGNKWEAG